VNLEQLPEEELDRLSQEFDRIKKRAAIEKEAIELEKVQH